MPHRLGNFISSDIFDELSNSGTIMSTENGRLLVGWGKRTRLSEPKESDDAAFYFPRFFLDDDHPWFEHSQWVETTPDALLKIIPRLGPPPQIEWNNFDYVKFQSAYQNLQDLFREQTLSKAVPYVFETSPSKMTKERLIYSLRSILEYAHSRPLNIYGYWENREGMLGATPELLFRLKQDPHPILETVACAGTCRHDSSKHHFVNDFKENHEHRLVIDGIKDSLSLFGTICAGKTEVLELPTLSHLLTPIKVNLNANVQFDTIVKALHPTPALGAFPRLQGDSWLRSYQNSINRGRYGAPAGYVKGYGKEACCFVAIRNVQWNDQGLAIGAGSGIVKDSILENEWQEVNLKIRTIKEMLSL